MLNNNQSMFYEYLEIIENVEKCLDMQKQLGTVKANVMQYWAWCSDSNIHRPDLVPLKNIPKLALTGELYIGCLL